MTDYKQICRNLIAAIRAEAREHTLGFELLKAYAEADAALATPEDEMEGTVKSDSELDLLVIAIQALRNPAADGHELDAVDRGRELLREALVRWSK